MAVAEATELMTTEQMLALPDNGMERWLIRGQLREAGKTILHPWRDRWHSRTMVCVSSILDTWLDQQPQPRGLMLCGGVGVRLARDPDTTIGVDVAYISAEVAARKPDDTMLINGPPILAVEILSGNDIYGQIDEKIDRYLLGGVAVVWSINPRRRTVTIYRPNQDPQLVGASQELSGEPHLPGFRVAVADLFA